MSSYRYDIAPSVPSVVEDIRAMPPRHATHHEPEAPENAVGLAEILAHLIMAGVIYYAMWRSIADVRTALIAAVLYFGSATTLRILARTHTLSALWQHWLDYRLEKHRINTMAALAGRHFNLLELEANLRQPQVIREPIVEPTASNFVAPHTPTAIGEALAWAESLYGPDGFPDPRRMHAHNGKVKIAVVGSRRAGGSQDAKAYLQSRGFLDMRDGGAWVRVDRYPTVAELSRLRPRIVRND